MPPILEPFGTQNDTNCLPEGSPKIDQKTDDKKFENGAKMDEALPTEDRGETPQIINNPALAQNAARKRSKGGPKPQKAS